MSLLIRWLGVRYLKRMKDPYTIVFISRIWLRSTFEETNRFFETRVRIDYQCEMKNDLRRTRAIIRTSLCRLSNVVCYPHIYTIRDVRINENENTCNTCNRGRTYHSRIDTMIESFGNCCHIVFTSSLRDLKLTSEKGRKSYHAESHRYRQVYIMHFLSDLMRLYVNMLVYLSFVDETNLRISIVPGRRA